MDFTVCQNHEAPFRRHLPHTLSEKRSTGGGAKCPLADKVAAIQHGCTDCPCTRIWVWDNCGYACERSLESLPQCFLRALLRRSVAPLVGDSKICFKSARPVVPWSTVKVKQTRGFASLHVCDLPQQCKSGVSCQRTTDREVCRSAELHICWFLSRGSA